MVPFNEKKIALHKQLAILLFPSRVIMHKLVNIIAVKSCYQWCFSKLAERQKPVSRGTEMRVYNIGFVLVQEKREVCIKEKFPE
jgi:hypothetical protein